MAFRGDLEALVLASLEPGPKHGYAIVKWIRTGAEGVFKTGEAQLYPILHRLEESEMLASEWVPQEGKPARKVYSLTESGRRELVKRSEKWKAFRGAMDQLMPDVEGA